MEETALQGFLPPMMADALLLMNIAMSVVLMFACAYLATRNNNSEIRQLNDKIKKLSRDLKDLEDKVGNSKPQKKVDSVIEVEPFGFNPRLPRQDPNEVTEGAWKKFVDNYNLIAASMLVPGQLKACQKFVEENELRMLQYSGMMNFIPATEVGESNYWLWKMPNEKNLYAVVPNPMKPCDEELYERGGLKMVFAINYKDGVYKKYIVETPAFFTIDNTNRWKVKDPGVVNLERK